MSRDSFRIEGVGCWCPDGMTLQQLRLNGHTEKCTEARRGWEGNYRHMREMDRVRAVDQEVGRQLREAAQAVLASNQERRSDS